MKVYFCYWSLWPIKLFTPRVSSEYGNKKQRSFFEMLENHVNLSFFIIVSYYSNWSQSRPSGADFNPEDIDPELCTHIIYAFGKIENKQIIGTKSNDLNMGKFVFLINFLGNL